MLVHIYIKKAGLNGVSAFVSLRSCSKEKMTFFFFEELHCFFDQDFMRGYFLLSLPILEHQKCHYRIPSVQIEIRVSSMPLSPIPLFYS